MKKIEGKSKVSIKDHFRQSSVLYLLGVILFLMYPRCQVIDYATDGVSTYCGNNPDFIVEFINITLIITVIAIVTNILYILFLKYWKKRM